jgi:patched domain-containing protein
LHWFINNKTPHSINQSLILIPPGVFGQFYWLGFDLDPMVMAAFLMSIGLSVDFCAHIVYHFQFDYREEFVEMSETAVVLYMRHPVESRFERIKLVLSTVAWPILQSGLSTMLCICPLIAVQVQ